MRWQLHISQETRPLNETYSGGILILDFTASITVINKVLLFKYLVYAILFCKPVETNRRIYWWTERLAPPISISLYMINLRGLLHGLKGSVANNEGDNNVKFHVLIVPFREMVIHWKRMKFEGIHHKFFILWIWWNCLVLQVWLQQYYVRKTFKWLKLILIHSFLFIKSLFTEYIFGSSFF